MTDKIIKVKSWNDIENYISRNTIVEFICDANIRYKCNNPIINIIPINLFMVLIT